jgi:serine/threonine-protein kinase
MRDPASRVRPRLTARAHALGRRLARASGRTPAALEDLAPRVAPIEDLAPGAKVGPYVIERALGRGGMAIVYQARDEHGGRLALKVARPDEAIDPQCRHRMMLEALVLDGLRHPAIAGLVDLGQLPDGRPWLALELVAGEPLNQRLARGRVSIDEACAIVLAIADALAIAHAAGVVHRDLKPDNVILSAAPSGPRCKVIDWGVARSRRHPDVRLTAVGVVSGTPIYMSPEQARGREVDGKSDIYALGVMLFEMLCGQVPFDGDDSVSILLHHVSSTPPPPGLLRADLPGWLERLVLAMLAKAPDARPSLAAIGRVVRSRGAALDLAA